MLLTYPILFPALVLCAKHTTDSGFLIFHSLADMIRSGQLGKSVLSNWTQDLPRSMLPDMIRVISTDMSVSDYRIMQNEFVTQEDAERQCKLMTMQLATFKNVEMAASVIKVFRKLNCPDCGRFTAWIHRIRTRCTSECYNGNEWQSGMNRRYHSMCSPSLILRKRRNKCTFISLQNGTLGDGDYCERSRRQQKDVKMLYICEHVLREASPFESKMQNGTAMYDTNSPYDAKRMITRIHILHPSDESGQGRILSWAGAKQECARFGYELSSLSKNDVDKIGNNIDPKGLYWVARRKEDIKKGLCTVLSAFDTNKLAAKDCKGDFIKESDRILGYICVSHHRMLKPPVTKGKRSKFKNSTPVKNMLTSKKSTRKNPDTKTLVDSKPDSKESPLPDKNLKIKVPSVNSEPSSKKSIFTNKHLKTKPLSVYSKPSSKKSILVNNNPSSKKSPSMGKYPLSKKIPSGNNKPSNKKSSSSINNNPSSKKRLSVNNSHKSVTTRNTPKYLIPVFDKFQQNF